MKREIVCGIYKITSPSEESIYNRVQKILKLVLNTQTGIYYIGVREAADSISMNHRTLTNMLSGHRKNKTPLIYT